MLSPLYVDAVKDIEYQTIKANLYKTKTSEKRMETQNDGLVPPKLKVDTAETKG